MSDTKYTYAVARIRALEVSLFSSSTIEQLIACKDHESCLRFLTEHGWGGVDVPLNADAIQIKSKLMRVKAMNVKAKERGVVLEIGRAHV